MGHVVIERALFRGEPDTYDTNKVWSLQGNHYLMDGTGLNCDSLVLTDDPAVELTYWKARLQLIENANHEDNLKLIAENLDRMRARINELETRHVNVVER